MDDRSPERRSATMRAVKSKNTKLEQTFFKFFSNKNVAGIEKFPNDITGKPDLIHREAKVAVFIDSCFWHGCAQHLRMPATNRDYWEIKISKNQKRDKKNNKTLLDSGWLVIRIWEHSFGNIRLMKWWATRIKNIIKYRIPSPEIPSASP